MSWWSPSRGPILIVKAFIKGKGNLKKLTCNFCGKEGHWESKCRLKKNQTSGKNDARGKPDTKKNSSFEKNEPGGKKENSNGKAEGQTQNKCSHCGNSNHTSDRCWKKRKEEKKKKEVNLIDDTWSDNEAEAREAVEDFQFLAKCDVLVTSDDNNSHERAPLELNKELEAWAIIDSGAEVSIMLKEIFEKINVPELKAPLDVYAFKGSKVTLNQVKKILTKTTNKQGIFKYYCFDFKDLERIILSRKTLQELGMVISGVPATFPSGRKEALKEKLEQSKVFGGLNKEKENLHNEVQHLKELANKLLKELKEDLKINAALGDKAYCNIPGSDFIVKIKEGQGPVYKRQ